MNATERLRKLLDEYGVKYSYEDVTEGTLFVVTRDVRIYYILAREKGFKVWSDWLTPEQAIAATLGPGTCKVETTENWLPAERYHRCKHCGAFFAVLDASGDIPPRVCPNCGRRVVSE